MPRYRFRWENLDSELLDALCAGEGLDGTPPSDALRGWYGARPKPDFVAEKWVVLRDSWLPSADQPRSRIVTTLRHCGLGDPSIDSTGRDGQLRYLRSCRNHSTLREVVLDEVIAAGEAPNPALAPKRTTRSPAWDDFEQLLATALRGLEEDQYLIVSVKGTGLEQEGDTEGAAYYVQFAGQGSIGLRSEAVSNAFLLGDERLGESAIDRLRALGWEAPTDIPEAPHGEQDPDGSVNYYRDDPQPVPFEDVSRRAAATLHEVFTATHPGALEYSAFDSDGDQIVIAGLGLKRQPAAPTVELEGERESDMIEPEGPEELREAVVHALNSALSEGEVTVDDDGDIPLTFGTTSVFVRVNDKEPVLHVFAPVLLEVRASGPLLDAINDINRDYPFVSASWTEGMVTLRIELWADPFVPRHLFRAVSGLGDLADEIDDDLQRRFGGRVLFGRVTHRPTESGGYL